LADDLDHQTIHIVRSRDLMASAAAQLFMAGKLEAEGFRQARFIHPPLITSAEGRKLSKSDTPSPLRPRAGSG
jgi:glutamyl/glutaminyl-tRNA synthetase